MLADGCVFLYCTVHHACMQGSLGPYQKIMVEFLFMPNILKSSVGWSQHQGIPLQRDYSLFVHFMQVGISTGIQTIQPKCCYID